MCGTFDIYYNKIYNKCTHACGAVQARVSLTHAPMHSVRAHYLFDTSIRYDILEICCFFVRSLLSFVVAVC